MMAPASYDDRGRRLLDSEEAAAAPAPTEDEEGTLELATERGRLGGRTGMNFGTGTLYTQNRFDNRRRQLLDNHAAPAPEDEAELVMSTERGRIGGRTGYNFGTGQLYTQNRFDDRRRLLEAEAEAEDHDDHDDDDDHDHDHEAEAEPAAAVVDDEMASMMMMMAPEPEFDLATSRSRVNQDPATLSRPELRFGNYLPLLGQSGRKLLEEAAAPAPEAGELDLATERGRLGGRTGFNFGSGTLYTQNRFDN